MQTIYNYTLEETSLDNGKLYHVKKNSKLVVKCGPRLITKNVRLFCNVPSEETANFDRSRYYEYKWTKPERQVKNDVFDEYIEIWFKRAGSFDFYFVVCDDEQDIKNAKGGAIIVVQPELKFSNGQPVNLDWLQVQTVLTKQLGPLNEWESRLQVSKECGYNMLHFVPTEESSKISNSPYSIRDHLKLNAVASGNGSFGQDDLKVVIEKIYKEWNMFSISDLVYNHISVDAPFIEKHPEAAYNLENSPFLKPAFILDRVFYYLSRDIENGKYESIGRKVNDESLGKIRELLKTELLPKVKFDEFYCLDVDKLMETIAPLIESEAAHVDASDCWSQVKIIQTSPFHRFSATVDYELLKEIIRMEKNFGSEDIFGKVKDLLLTLNEDKRTGVYSWLDSAVESLINTAVAALLNMDSEIGTKKPLTPAYFYYPFEYSSVEEEESKLLANDPEFLKRIMVHNGWVMNQDPLVNFCSPESTVFMKRELNSWTDLVRLRYGDKPDDCPKLWEYMAEYTRKVASIFHGVRLDNCHNTPLHVAQYFMDMARTVQPDLYVMAELFTNSPITDNMFASKLAINSLIRESKNANSPSELSGMVNYFSGKPVGSLVQGEQVTLQESNANAVFFDITHDNKSLISQHTVYDQLSRAALLNMCSCASGSTRGYDELVPHDINVVEEQRLYAKWGAVNINDGILMARRAFNQLHFKMGVEGYSEIFIDQLNDEVITVTRHNPDNHEKIILLAKTAFNSSDDAKALSEYQVPMKLEKLLFEAKLVEASGEYTYEQDESVINGLKNYKLEFQDDLGVDFEKSIFLAGFDNNNESETKIHFKDLSLGSIVTFLFKLHGRSRQVIQDFQQELKQLHEEKSDFNKIVNELSLNDLNILLFRSANEEKVTADEKVSTFFLPNYGQLRSFGLETFVDILRELHLTNDLAHALFQSLREDNCILDHIVNRLKAVVEASESLVKLTEWLELVFHLLSEMPRYLIPSYFDTVVTALHKKLVDRIFGHMNSELVKNGSSFVRMLTVASVQFVGECKTAQLKNTIVNLEEGTQILSIAAGLPNYASDLLRSLTRDTFMSLRGLLLLTGRYEEAKRLILVAGSCVKNGLLPKTLSCAEEYNSLDGLWWWLKAIKDYTEATNDFSILQEEVYRDDGENHVKQKLLDIIQEALTRQVNERVDLKTGFVFSDGHLQTWMETARDGSPVEIIGLVRNVLSWLVDANSNFTHYPYDSVKLSSSDNLSWKDWAARIDSNFESHFWIETFYRDSVQSNSSQKLAEEQLRSNFLIALALAPQMVNKEHALKALEQCEKHLYSRDSNSSIGIKTLLSNDQNNNCSDEESKCREWPWLMYYYIKSKLNYSPDAESSVVCIAQDHLAKCYECMQASEWKSLPQYTNENGSKCDLACPSQAVSIASVLEIIHDISN